jgi:hypothetical protein
MGLHPGINHAGEVDAAAEDLKVITRFFRVGTMFLSEVFRSPIKSRERAIG